MQRFTQLKVWERGHRFVLAIYRASKDYPTEERFGLTSQLRRAAVSVPNNIAEGSKRRGRGEYAHQVNIAEASLSEVENLLILSRDLGYLPEVACEAFLREADEIQRMLNALRRKIETAGS
jgi:four helix bundle protein